MSLGELLPYLYGERWWSVQVKDRICGFYSPSPFWPAQRRWGETQTVGGSRHGEVPIQSSVAMAEVKEWGGGGVEWWSGRRGRVAVCWS